MQLIIIESFFELFLIGFTILFVDYLSPEEFRIPLFWKGKPHLFSLIILLEEIFKSIKMERLFIIGIQIIVLNMIVFIVMRLPIIW